MLAVKDFVSSVIPIDAIPRKEGKHFGFDKFGRWDENDMILRKDFAESVELKDDEYINGETGLVTCKFCHSPRQNFIDKFFGWMHLNCDCKGLEDEMNVRKKRIINKARANRMIAFEDYPLGKKYTFANDDKKNNRASDMAMDYCVNFERRRNLRKNGLIIWGTVGTGKTYMATAIMNEIITRYGYLVKFIRIAELVSAVSDFKTSRTAFEPYKSCSAIVLDDFGTENPDGNGRVMSAMTRFLDFCENYCIPLIVTTNLSADDFTSRVNELSFRRVADRLVGRSEFMGIRGESRRQF